VAVFAITLAIGWSGEERAGRLEVELTSPISRRRYFVQRTGAALLAAVVAVAITGVAFMTAVWLAGAELEWGRALAAVVVLAPLGGVVVAFGFALSGWRPVVVAAVLPAAVAVSFFMDLLAPLFSLPDAVRTLSAFNLYGQPLVEGVRWGSLAAMLVLIAAFTLVGAVAFSRRDIVK
jgi:ABC-2 type transport system permease protein